VGWGGGGVLGGGGSGVGGVGWGGGGWFVFGVWFWVFLVGVGGFWGGSRGGL